MKKKNKEIQPYWHPDFRIQSTLPDIKVVRTGFLINLLAVILFLAAAIYAMKQEYTIRSLESTTQAMESRISETAGEEARLLKESERFRTAAGHVEDLQKFYSAPFAVHHLLQKLTELKPDDLIFSSLGISEMSEKVGDKAVMVYSININGEVRELPILNRFKGVLQEADFLNPQGFSAAVDEMVQPPNELTRIFPYRLSIKISPVVAQGGGK